MPHVFISYVREDSRLVNGLCTDLARHGVEVWIDRDSIKPGTLWKDAIRAAIKDGDFFVACFSKEYAGRTTTYMNDELEVALLELREHGPSRAWFIPLLLSECEVPALPISGGETLRDIQSVSLFRNWERGIQTMLDVIKPIPPRVSSLMRVLASGDRTVRMAALDELDAVNDPRAVPAIAPLLGGDDRETGLKAARLIAKIGGPFAAPALAAFIRSAEPDTRIPPEDDYGSYSTTRFETGVRVAATGALRELRDRAVTPFLLDALKDPEYYVRACAADALAATRDTTAVPRLIGLLADPDSGVRENALKALGGIGDRASVPALLAVLGDREKRPDERLGAAEALGGVGDPIAIPALLAAMKEIQGWRKDTSNTIGVALRRIGSSLALPMLFEDLRGRDPTIRETAASVLGAIGDPAAVPALIQALEDPVVPIHVYLVGNMLGAVGDETVLPRLTEALQNGNSAVRRRAAYALQVLCIRVLRPPSWDVSAAGELAEQSLTAALSDSDAGVRAHAAESLCVMRRECKWRRSETQREVVFRSLAEALEREKDARVQRVMIEGLKRSFRNFDEGKVLDTILSSTPDIAKPSFLEPDPWESFEQSKGD